MKTTGQSTVRVSSKAKRKILTNQKAELLLKEAEDMYSRKGGIQKIMDLGSQNDLKFDRCVPCDALTPTVSTVVTNCCLVCGSAKSI